MGYLPAFFISLSQRLLFGGTVVGVLVLGAAPSAVSQDVDQTLEQIPRPGRGGSSRSSSEGVPVAVPALIDRTKGQGSDAPKQVATSRTSASPTS